MALDTEVVLKVITGVVGAGGVAALINHFFASGNNLLSDKRKDKDDLHTELIARIKILQSQLTEFTKRSEWEGETRHALKNLVNWFSWSWTDKQAHCHRVAELLRSKQEVPEFMIEELDNKITAEEIIEKVKLPEPYKAKVDETEKPKSDV